MIRPIPLATLLLASCTQSDAAPELRVSEQWARETVAGQSATAAYLTISNSGDGADRLIAVTAPAPAEASLHGTTRSGGIARMRPLDDGLEIAARATVRLAPGGEHIMIENLRAPLRPGETLRVVLRFERSGQRSVALPVRAAGSGGPMPQDH